MSENHLGVNFAMRVKLGDFAGKHGDANDFRLAGVDVLDAGADPLHPVVGRWAGEELAPLDTEEGAHEAASIGLDENAPGHNVPGHRDVRVHAEGVLGPLEQPVDRDGVGSVADDGAIDEDADGTGGPDRVNPAKLGNFPKNVENDERGHVAGEGRHEAHGLDDADRMTFGSLDGADKAPRGAVELAGRQELARLFDGRLNPPNVRERGVIGHAVENLRNPRLGGVGQRGRVGGAQALHSKVSGGEGLLELALDGGDLQDLVEIVEDQSVNGLAGALPVVVIDFVDKLAANVLADLLKQLAKQVGQESAGGHDSFVGVGVPVVRGQAAAGDADELVHHFRNGLELADAKNLESRGIPGQSNVRQELGVEKGDRVRNLVVGSGRVLEVLAQVLDGLVLGKDAEVGALFEGCGEVIARCVGPNQSKDVLVGRHAEGSEKDHEGNVFPKAGDAHGQRVAKTVELGRDANLGLFGREREALVQALQFYAMSVLGRGLLVGKDHDAVVGDLFLGENDALSAVNDKVAKRVVRALAELLGRHGVVLEHAERRAEHDGNLAERYALKDLLLFVHVGERGARIGAGDELDVDKHLSGVGKVSYASFVRHHLLQAPRGLLNPRLHVAHIVEREAELVLVLFGGLILLVPDDDRRCGAQNQGQLVVEKVLVGLDLRLAEPCHPAARLEVSPYCVHSCARRLACKYLIHFE